MACCWVVVDRLMNGIAGQLLTRDADALKCDEADLNPANALSGVLYHRRLGKTVRLGHLSL
ncbi:hypothetical protein IBA8401_38970 [Pseudomonas syringae]